MREALVLGGVVVSVVCDRILFWGVATRLPSFRWPLFVIVCLVNVCMHFNRTAFARGDKEYLVCIAFLSVMHGLLALLAAGCMEEPWRCVLLMHAGSLYYLADQPKRSSWTVPAVLCLCFGILAAIISDKNPFAVGLYTFAWLLGGQSDRLRRHLVADGDVQVCKAQESIAVLIACIICLPCYVPFQRFFAIGKLAPPLSSVSDVLSNFHVCLLANDNPLESDQCGIFSGLISLGWIVAHFTSALLVKLAASFRPVEDVAVIHTAALVIAALLLFTRIHDVVEIVSAALLVSGMVFCHAKNESDADEASLLENR